MKILSTIAFSFIVAVALGQSLSPWVLGTSGGFHTNQGNSLSWTVGEVEVATLNNSTSFLTQGFQQPWVFFNVDTQRIYIRAEWSLFSTYIVADNPTLPAVFAPVLQNIDIVKDESGKVFWPAFGINLIGNVQMGKGYQVKASQADTLEVIGEAVVPENTPIIVPSGWSLLGYLRKTPATAPDILSPIVANILIVKDYSGKAYWPYFGLNQIGDLAPGDGYLINTTADSPFTFPANSQSFAKSTIQQTSCVHYPTVNPSETNLTFAIPFSAWDIPPYRGDEIAVYSNSGVLVGTAVFEGDVHVMSVWGDDSQTDPVDGMIEGESFFVSLWHSQTDTEEIVLIEEWDSGSEKYKVNDICVAAKVVLSGNLMDNEIPLQCRNYPNPFYGYTTFELFLPEPSMVRFELFNLLGEAVDLIMEQECSAGTHKIPYQNITLAPGTYIYKVSTANGYLAKYISILNKN